MNEPVPAPPLRRVPEAVFAALARHDTPTVSNVIELFDVRSRSEGFLDGRIRALFPRLGRAVGHATTATFRSAEPPARGDAYSTLADQVEHLVRTVPEPRIVVFQDLDPEPRGATFGEVMCTVYKAFGCAGLITSGGGRDLEQVERLGFPCWAATVVASHAWCRIVDVGMPVQVGGCRVEPGDLVHADPNGVLLVPRVLVREVALGCELLVQAEEDFLRYARGWNPTPEGLREAYRRLKDDLARIPARVRRGLAPDSGASVQDRKGSGPGR